MHLNRIGEIVDEEWKRSETLRPEICLDAWTILPNHLHGIVCVVPPGTSDANPRGYRLRNAGDFPCPQSVSSVDVGTTRASSSGNAEIPAADAKGPPSRSVSAMVGAFKSAATRRIRRYLGDPDVLVWQPRFRDRILRNEREWRARRTYIDRNPGRW